MLVTNLSHQVLFPLLDSQQLCSLCSVLVCLAACVPVDILAFLPPPLESVHRVPCTHR